MAKHNKQLTLKDTSSFTDADWAAWNELAPILETQGRTALLEELKRMVENNNPCGVHIAYALFPTAFVDKIKDQMAAAGMALDDLKEMLKNAEPSRH